MAKLPPPLSITYVLGFFPYPSLPSIARIRQNDPRFARVNLELLVENQYTL